LAVSKAYGRLPVAPEFAASQARKTSYQNLKHFNHFGVTGITWIPVICIGAIGGSCLTLQNAMERRLR
jgi:hypothetical protein